MKLLYKSISVLAIAKEFKYNLTYFDFPNKMALLCD